MTTSPAAIVPRLGDPTRSLDYHACLTLDEQVERLSITIRPDRAVPADLTGHQTDVDLFQLAVRHDLLYGAGAQIGQEHIRRREQPDKRVLALGRLRVE
jgi:hypothetical protein